MKSVRIVLLVTGLVAFSTACASSGASTSFESGKVKVAAALYPIEEIVRAVGGSQVSLVELIPPGQPAHDYEPTPRQITDLQSADVVFYFGGGFQPSVEKAVASLPNSVRKVDLLKSVELIPISQQLAGTEGEVDGEVLGDGSDPHVWLSPANMQLMVEQVRAVLVAFPSVDAPAAAAAAASFTSVLAKLDTDFSSGLANCESRVIVTAHRAFGYVAHDYNLEQIAIAGVSPTDEPSAKTLEAIARSAKKNKVATIFFETGLPAELSKTIANEVGATTAVLDSVESLSNEQIADGANYVSVMQSNLATLEKGLACS
ncbi:MAG: zinc ABC transporter substrate-binding protein [Actinobacteria bacterium]|uniref:Unannotated protein n=1 Tax=freshwater metagenome TaxID=449393 RepID=A0A6J6YGC0_9ZZZZ|nr:zinc ABC transporter substrate-binding protein [Actinomycetota bacterium]